jgi:acetoin utilization protein AcuB
MRADEIMTADVITLKTDQTLADAIEVLSERGFRHLPVLGDDGQLVGMLSDRDLRSLGIGSAIDTPTLRKAQEQLRTSVAATMQADVAKVTPDTELNELIDTMLEAGVGALPVVDEDSDALLGIVSYVDVLRAVRDEAARA